MGTPKALLPFGHETMLARMVRIVAAEASPVVVVAAVDQALRDLPSDVLLAHDAVPECGPLAGLSAGLQALDGLCDAAFVTGCDTPLLQPKLIRSLRDSLGTHAAAIPWFDDRWHPLTAVYRLSVRGEVDARLASRQLKLQDFANAIRPFAVDEKQLRSADPTLASLRNVNTPEDYQNALAELAAVDAP
jgi:molybdopterin-guanine dinucleotide biosynthesis protein A